MHGKAATGEIDSDVKNSYGVLRMREVVKNATASSLHPIAVSRNPCGEWHTRGMEAPFIR